MKSKSTAVLAVLALSLIVPVTMVLLTAVPNAQSTSVGTSCSPASVGIGATSTCTATLSEFLGSVTGELITWYQSGGTGSVTFSSRMCALSSDETCSVTVTGATAGSVAIDASYAGDNSYGNTGGLGTAYLTVIEATTTTFSCSPSSIPYTGFTTCTATVSNVDSTYSIAPSGTVSLSGGPTGFPASCTLSGGSCTVTFNAAPNTEGAYTITAFYGGDSTHGPSSGTGSLTIYTLVIYTPTTTTISCSPTTGTVGVSETCTATVTNVDSVYTVKATGTVTFGGTPPGMPTTCTLTSGTGTYNSCPATWTPASGTQGSYSISASYGGDTTHASSSTSSPAALSIQAATYSVTFDQTGIPTSGATWGVTVDSVDHTGTGASIVVTGISGTGVPYGYDSPVAGTTGVQYSCSTGCSGTVSGAATESAAYLTQYYLTVSSSQGTPTGEGWYSSGSIATFGMTSTTVSGGAGTQYVFSGWSSADAGGYTGSNNPASVTMNNPITETANWQMQYEVTFLANPVASGTVSPSAAAYYAQGAVVPLAATPNAGYALFSWSSSTGSITFASSVSASTTATIAGTGTITANFVAVTVGVSCSPNPDTVGVSTLCTATITPGTLSGIVSWQSSGSGSFGSDGQCAVSTGACSVGFTPASGSEGAQTITAMYSGGASGSTDLTVVPASTSTTVSCAPTSFGIGATSSCTATVSGGSSPSGTVKFSQSSGTGGVGFYSGYKCTLSSGSCPITVTGASLGSVTIQAAYGGDSDNNPSSGTTSIAVKTATSTSVSCIPAIFAVGSASTCWATVSGGYSPTGTVTFTPSLTGVVTPNLATCTLSPSYSCSITVRGAAPASFAMTATYGGDSNNQGSSGYTTLTVAQDVITTTISPQTTTSSQYLSGQLCSAKGTVSMAFGPTHVNVTLVNFTARIDTSVMITVTNLGFLPSGTTGLTWPAAGGSTTGLPWFFELQVSGITDGKAVVCIYSSQVLKTTQMKYYYGGWQNVTKIIVFPGSLIIGDIPVSALNSGAQVVIGTPIDPQPLQSQWMMHAIRNLWLRPFAERGPFRWSFSPC